MSPREHAGAYFGLSEDLEALLGRRVDLVERRAIRNPYVKRSMEETREIIYDAA